MRLIITEDGYIYKENVVNDPIDKGDFEDFVNEDHIPETMGDIKFVVWENEDLLEPYGDDIQCWKCKAIFPASEIWPDKRRFAPFHGGTCHRCFWALKID